jgi:hypothetical protein
MKGDFKINEFIKSPLTPLYQRGEIKKKEIGCKNSLVK